MKKTRESRSKADLTALEGALKPGKNAVIEVREMRSADCGREKKRLGL